jgi:hypothetical protein
VGSGKVERGQIDLYDSRGNRTGYGKTSDGHRIELFDRSWNRAGEVRINGSRR